MMGGSVGNVFIFRKYSDKQQLVYKLEDFIVFASGYTYLFTYIYIDIS